MIPEAPEEDEGDFLSDGDGIEYENGRNTAGRYTATGNEADIEDNVQPPSTPTPIMLTEMLRAKPLEILPITPCRLASAREEFMKNITLGPPSTAERLTNRAKSAIESITDTIERPEGAVPTLALPSWHSLPLDTKIPGIRSPAGLLYYSSGTLSSQLHRKTKGFNLTDPYNRERVVRSPYTALHDPHAKDFVNRPTTKRLLHKQGLINKNNEVIYSLREFNSYRNYLRTVYNDDVHESVHGADELWKKEQTQLRSINQYLMHAEGREDLQTRLGRAQQFSKQKMEFMISRIRHKQHLTEARFNAFARQKQQMHAEKVVRNTEKYRLQQEKLKLLLEDRQRIAAEIYRHTIMKDLHSLQRRTDDAKMMKKAQENQLLEWMESKINHSRERVDRYNRVDISCRENLRRRAAKRQRRVETYRRNMPIIIEKRKAEEAHHWAMAKKYFHIWLHNVRRRKAESFHDADHQTCFIQGVVETLSETVEYLRFQTNTTGRLDDFILNIIKLKNDIKRQLELEELEEGEIEDIDLDDDEEEEEIKNE